MEPHLQHRQGRGLTEGNKLQEWIENPQVRSEKGKKTEATDLFLYAIDTSVGAVQVGAASRPLLKFVGAYDDETYKNVKSAEARAVKDIATYHTVMYAIDYYNVVVNPVRSNDAKPQHSEPRFGAAGYAEKVNGAKGEKDPVTEFGHYEAHEVESRAVAYWINTRAIPTNCTSFLNVDGYVVWAANDEDWERRESRRERRPAMMQIDDPLIAGVGQSPFTADGEVNPRFQVKFRDYVLEKDNVGNFSNEMRPIPKLPFLYGPDMPIGNYGKEKHDAYTPMVVPMPNSQTRSLYYQKGMEPGQLKAWQRGLEPEEEYYSYSYGSYGYSQGQGSYSYSYDN